jgi:hypothetical protein
VPRAGETPDVYFYVPSRELVAEAPCAIEDYWGWIDQAAHATPAPLPPGSSYAGKKCTWLGPYNWTLQTFIRLREHGFPCHLTHTIPPAGIVITHSDFLPRFLRPTRQQFFVEIKPDRLLNCRFANFVIVQNRHDPIRSGFARWLIDSAFVYYWPQPGLVSRNADRGDRFENICFMGNERQFLKEGQLIAAELTRLGLMWRMVPRSGWHDYSEVDAVVAIRRVNPATLRDSEPLADEAPLRKPPSKLYNAWLAGVPAILSSDDAFQELRQSHLDFLEANDVPGLIARVKELKADPSLRRAMVEHGRARAVDFTASRIASMWVDIIQDRILPGYLRWRRSALHRGSSLVSRNLVGKLKPTLW